MLSSLLLFSCTSCPEVEAIRIHNATSVTIDKVYIRQSGMDDWLQLSGFLISSGSVQSLKSGESFSPHKKYDMKVTGSSSVYTKKNITLEQGKTITFVENDGYIKELQIKNETGNYLHRLYIMEYIGGDVAEDYFFPANYDFYIPNNDTRTAKLTYSRQHTLKYNLRLKKYSSEEIYYIKYNLDLKDGDLITFTSDDKEDIKKIRIVNYTGYDTNQMQYKLSSDSSWTTNSTLIHSNDQVLTYTFATALEYDTNYDIRIRRSSDNRYYVLNNKILTNNILLYFYSSHLAQTLVYSNNFNSGSGTINWGGHASWYYTSSTYYDASYSLASGNIGDNQYSDFYVYQTNNSAGHIEFAFRVSSEFNYDWLEFYINDTIQNRWSGTWSWQTITYDVPAGYNIYLWRYDKDVSGYAGSDKAWIDSIKIYEY
jgi:hypothetical protein